IFMHVIIKRIFHERVTSGQQQLQTSIKSVKPILHTFLKAAEYFKWMIKLCCESMCMCVCMWVCVCIRVCECVVVFVLFCFGCVRLCICGFVCVCGSVCACVCVGGCGGCTLVLSTCLL